MFRLLPVLLLLCLGGCKTVHYTFAPPKSDSGRLCVVQCASIRETCRGNEINRAAAARFACERQQDRAYQECRARNAGSKDKPAACDTHAYSCTDHGNTGYCEQDYRRCYSDCGGRVTEIVEE